MSKTSLVLGLLLLAGCSTGPFVTDVYAKPDGTLHVKKCKLRAFTFMLTNVWTSDCETQVRKVRR